MPERPSTDEREDAPFEELRPSAPVFEVAPIRARTRVPFIALVGLVVGVAAFVAGIGVASAGPTPRPGRSIEPVVAAASRGPEASVGTGGSIDAGPAAASPVSGATGAGPDAAAPTPRSSLPPPGTSAFATSFRPDEIVATTVDGARCSGGEARQKEVPRTRRDGPRLTFQRSWLLWCEVPEARRQAFLLDVFEAFVRVIPADTYGYNAAGIGAGDALFPYAQPPLAGTVAVTADEAGKGFAIAIILQEWRSDQAR
ncbi:MAG TPA: hypothetical protein VES19_02865 [Candidatus Limnocylindrales bacterium]|nr:hypothetical protein [Candidatus Limnocylindrales bacterium]